MSELKAYAKRIVIVNHIHFHKYYACLKSMAILVRESISYNGTQSIRGKKIGLNFTTRRIIFKYIIPFVSIMFKSVFGSICSPKIIMLPHRLAIVNKHKDGKRNMEPSISFIPCEPLICMGINRNDKQGDYDYYPFHNLIIYDRWGLVNG